tara:strand:- start:1871 stop:2419 length:549 start_codon:yes stop_codon:yes gene_type:complete
MASKVILKSNTVTGTAPTTGQIDISEFAVNLPDGILYGSNGTFIFEIGANNTQISVGANNVFGNSTTFVVNTGIQTGYDLRRSATVTTTSVTETTLASFTAASYGSGTFAIQATRGTERHLTNLSVTHDGTTPIATEYGTLITDVSLFTTDVDINTGSVRVRITSSNTTSTVFKTSYDLIGS